LELTPAGQIYYEGCRELLEKFRSIEDLVQRIQDRVAGTVRVAAIYSVGLMQMEQWEQQFAERYPEARLRVEYLHPDDVYRQVQGEEADIGLVSFPRSTSDLDCLDWQSQPMVLVVPPTHRLANRGEILLSELDGEDYVGFTQELTIRREVDKWLKRGRVSVQIVHEFDNIETIKRAIEIGSGVALLPRPAVWQEIASGRLVAIAVTDVELVRPLGIISRRHKQLKTAAQAFIGLLTGSAASGEGAHLRDELTSDENARRVDLIRKSHTTKLSVAEAAELAGLNGRLDRHLASQDEQCLAHLQAFEKKSADKRDRPPVRTEQKRRYRKTSKAHHD
jgi:DNA-binding transcriptional LysR family regulator